VEKKTGEYFAAFAAEINLVKKLFDGVRRAPPRSPLLPKYAGTARYAFV
jgi:dynein heavy chain